MERVLILTGRFGMGHVSAAAALKEQILQEYPSMWVEVVDLMEYTVPHLSRLIYVGFGFLARHGRSLYNFIYKQAGKRDENEWTPFTMLSMRKLSALFEEKAPSVVLSTLPLCSLLTAKYKEKRNPSLTLVTCITDISSHSEWLQPHTDYYLVGSDLVKEKLVEKGVREETILITGIPVGRVFCQETPTWEISGGASGAVSKEAASGDGQVKTGGKRLLIMGGGLGLLPKRQEFYRELNRIPGVKTTVLTGKNEKLYQRLSGRYENIEALAYTDRVDVYMKQADLVLSKPGGITLFEIIFSGKPLLMFEPFLEQEKNNMDFALYHNIGRVLSRKEKDWSMEIAHLMKNDRVLAAMTFSVNQLKEEYDKKWQGRIFGAIEEKRQAS